MKKLFLVCALGAASFTAPPAEPYFSGKIVYHMTYATPAGPEVAAKMAEAMGTENLYYVSGNNFKTYTEKKQLVQLYTGSDNQIQVFMNGQSVLKTDAGKGKPGAVVKPLSEKATIAGYPCQSMQVVNEAAGLSSTYFYSPRLRVDPQQFSKVAMGDFNVYLKASNGALPLRTIMTIKNMGMTMTTTQEATAVQAMALTAADFTADAPAR
jgi:hypothetical protein